MEAEQSRVKAKPTGQSGLIPSMAVLVGANLVPLYGVLFQGWLVFPIVLLFWLENVIVGAFSILRLLTVRPREPIGWIAKLFAVPFFTFHYGMFTAVHGVFVFALFGREMGDAGGFPNASLVLSAVGKYGMMPAVVALTLSHGFSYAWNYLGKGEFHRATINELMGRPYGRVVVLHVALIGSGFLLMALDAPVAGLVLLLILKIGLDVAAHRREHRRAAPRQEAAPETESAPY